MQANTPETGFGINATSAITAATTDFIQRHCPNCQSSKALLERHAEKRADQLTFAALAQHWSSFFKESCFFDYHRCQDCGMLYNQKFFSAQRLGELYSSMSDNTAGQDMTNMRKTQAGYFKMLNRVTLSKGHFIEFGPDIGLFSELVAKNCFFDQHFLIEPNLAVHDRLIQSVAPKPYQILTDLFDLSAIPDNSVALVVMIHVLDHMINPLEMMQAVEKKLVEGGVVLIVTHDEQSLLAKALKHRWPAHCLQHPHLFNVTSTKNFLTRAGFSAVQTAKSANYFSIPYLTQHLCWSLGIGKISLPQWPWSALPLRLGNIVTVAQKRMLQ